jgi:hypothetical protein
MKKISLSTTAALLALISCSKKETEPSYNKELVACQISNPITNLEWLNKEFRSLVGGPSTNAIVIYKYDDLEVIEIQGSTFSSTNQHQCDGQKINFDDPLTFNDFKQNQVELKVIYGKKIW